MKKLLFIAIFISSLFFEKDVNAQVGCCNGSVSSGTMTCPGSGTNGWYCSGTTTEYSCSGLDYGTCISTRPTPTNELECGADVPRCTGCGWSVDCSGGGGGGGGGGCSWSPVNCPAGTVVNYNNVLSSIISGATGCSQPGTAQTATCTNDGYHCDPDNEEDCWCTQYLVTTYACVSTNSDPIGNHDASTCSTTSGWACDQNSYSTPLNVHLYLDGAAGAGGTFLTSVTANQTREAAVGALCGGYTNHGFTYNTPTSLIDGIAHTIYAYAINTPTGNNPLLPSIQRTFTCTPTCSGITINPSNQSVSVSNQFQLTSVVNNISGTVSQVTYSSPDTSKVTITSPGTGPSYLATVTGVSPTTPNITITASAWMNGVVRCTGTATVTVTNPGPWWQVKDGDITAENGGILSTVPAATYFDTDGAGGFPGVPTYYNGSLNYGSGLLSTKQWSANTQTSQSRRFDYSYFNNLIPSDFVSPTTYDGYVWTKINGPHTLSATDFTTSKNVLFVNGDLNITGNIALTDGTGFFLAIVSGNINISPTVTNLEGIYLSDGTFSTGAGTVQLQTRGSVASYGGISLLRNLTNNTQPAELFTFAPDQIALFPEKLGFRRTRWTEVAP